MATTTRQRQIRFSSETDALIQQRADAQGISASEWLRRLALRELDDKQGQAIRAELASARTEHGQALELMRTELKSFVVEALVGLSERLTSSQEAFLHQLISQLPQAPGNEAALSELFSNHGAHK
jgi:hypothetical protein